MISITRDATVHCPACGGFVVVRLGGVKCQSCPWTGTTASNNRLDVEYLTEVRKTGEGWGCVDLDLTDEEADELEKLIEECGKEKP